MYKADKEVGMQRKLVLEILLSTICSTSMGWNCMQAKLITNLWSILYRAWIFWCVALIFSLIRPSFNPSLPHPHPVSFAAFIFLGHIFPSFFICSASHYKCTAHSWSSKIWYVNREPIGIRAQVVKTIFSAENEWIPAKCEKIIRQFLRHALHAHIYYAMRKRILSSNVWYPHRSLTFRSAPIWRIWKAWVQNVIDRTFLR